MTSATQTILDDILDWCIKSNISELTGKDKYDRQVKLIHFAAERGYVQVVKKLVDSGIDVNLPPPNENKYSPLHYASLNGHIEVAKLLLEKGAYVNCRDCYNSTPIHYASSEGHIGVAKLLLEKGANVNCQDNWKKTPLIKASEYDHLEVAKLLLKKGAIVNCEDNKNRTSLHYASRWNHLEVAKLLLQKGANINSRNEEKETPLHVASLNGKKEIVKILLDHGCDIDLKRFGRTAEDIAVHQGNHEIVELISRKRMELISLNQPQPSAPLMECKICFEDKNGVFAFLPCFHAPACEKCCRRIIQSSEPTCPICRSQVTVFQKIFT